eukprot:g18117.t1
MTTISLNQHIPALDFCNTTVPAAPGPPILGFAWDAEAMADSLSLASETGLKSAQRKAALPWTLVAKGCAPKLRQDATLKDVPMREGEAFPALPCVAFSATGIVAASQSFLDLAGENLEEVLGADLRRAPLHWLLPKMNKILNQEALVPLEKLHKNSFAGHIWDALGEEDEVQSSTENERQPVTVCLLLSPGREGKVFWNLVHAFKMEEVLAVHVLMPIAAEVPSIFWQLQQPAEGFAAYHGPIPELSPYLDVILQRLRSKLGKLQLQEARQETIQLQEPVPAAPARKGRRASDLGPMSSETSPHLPTDLIRVAMTRRISEVSLCSDLPDLDELWAAGAAPGLRCRALEAVEVRCRDLARALSDVFSGTGIHFVPRFGAAMALPYELYSFWEEVLANESQALMSHWKYGKKGDKNHRRELFNIEPYMILDPDEMDCTIAYMSQGLEDLFGYWRAWALGRHFRFLPLDQEVSEVLGGVEALQWASQDPTVFENQYDFSAKHFVLAVVLPLYTQMPALHDLLTTNDPEANLRMVGQHFVPRVGLAPVRDFQGLWPHLVRLLFRLKNPPREEMMRPTLLDQEEGLACWVADVRSRDLPLVFLSHALQKLTGFLADFALARTGNNPGLQPWEVLHLIELSMPAVLKSHQIPELNEDEMGMALDEWGVFLVQEREDVWGFKRRENPLKACEYYSAHFAAFLRTGEDYVGDLFQGLVEVHAFKGVLESLLEVLRSDLQRVLQDDQAEGKMDQVIMTVDYTGFQREWVLGRNCRFLQPKDFERNQQFNGDQLEHLRVFCAQARKFSMPSASNTFALLLNERRNGSPFWNLSSFHHLEVNEKRYIVSVMLPFREVGEKHKNNT